MRNAKCEMQNAQDPNLEKTRSFTSMFFFLDGAGGRAWRLHREFPRYDSRPRVRRPSGVR